MELSELMSAETITSPEVVRSDVILGLGERVFTEALKKRS